MNYQWVYVKTDKALEEIKARTFGLPNRMRTILILVDGQHTVRELSQRYKQFGDIEQIMEELEQEGFIAPHFHVEAVAFPLIEQDARTRATRIDAADEPRSEPLSGFFRTKKTVEIKMDVESYEPIQADDAPLSIDSIKLKIKEALTEAFGPMAGSLIMKLENCHTLDAVYLHVGYCRKVIEEATSTRKANQFWQAVQKFLPHQT